LIHSEPEWCKPAIEKAPNSPAEQPPAAAGMASDTSADEWTDVGL
jgi:hypothetical protein